MAQADHHRDAVSSPHREPHLDRPIPIPRVIEVSPASDLPEEAPPQALEFTRTPRYPAHEPAPDSGLYCERGDVYIDPWRPVGRAVVASARRLTAPNQTISPISSESITNDSPIGKCFLIPGSFWGSLVTS
jgi:hypothetical protein